MGCGVEKGSASALCQPSIGQPRACRSSLPAEIFIGASVHRARQPFTVRSKLLVTWWKCWFLSWNGTRRSPSLHFVCLCVYVLDPNVCCCCCCCNVERMTRWLGFFFSLACGKVHDRLDEDRCSLIEQADVTRRKRVVKGDRGWWIVKDRSC